MVDRCIQPSYNVLVCIVTHSQTPPSLFLGKELFIGKAVAKSKLNFVFHCILAMNL